MAAPALLFDLDGTVWDSYPWYAKLMATSGAISEAAVIERLRAGKSVVALLDRYAVTPARFQKYCRELQLFPGVRETLEELAGRATPMGAVTSLPGRLVLPMLDGIGLAGRFSAVIHAGNCRFRKPHPAPLLAALDELEVAANDSVFYVGDRQVDAEAAIRGGLAFAWASYGYGEGCPATAKVVLKSFSDVRAL